MFVCGHRHIYTSYSQEEGKTYSMQISLVYEKIIYVSLNCLIYIYILKNVFVCVHRCGTYIEICYMLYELEFGCVRINSN